jgi:hypothetical protein
MRGHTRWLILPLGVLFCSAILLAYRHSTNLEAAMRPPPGEPKKDAAPQKNGLDLVVTPLPDWFKYQSAGTVNGWVNDLDEKSITAHAWELWGALTTLTTQDLPGDKEQKAPIFETWWDRDEVLAGPGGLKSRKSGNHLIERPRQLLHEHTATTTTSRPVDTLFDDVKYNDDIKNHIRTNKYYETAVLSTINTGWKPDTPLADRKLMDFPSKSVMLKPVYQIVSGKGPTVLAYWAGPANSSTPSAPDPSTWTTHMVVVPPGLGIDPKTFKLRMNDQHVTAFPLSDFYHFKLTAEEAEAASKGLRIPNVAAGDYAILVAMHVSSREIDNWTWQTFWWSYSKPTIPTSVTARVKPPFDHYQVAVGYSFLTAPNNPNSLTLTCYNPYLEAGFSNTTFAKPGQLGIESSCMSCHRAAAWPIPPTGRKYVANGFIDPGDPFFFTGNTKTDFLWGIPFGVPAPAADKTP